MEEYTELIKALRCCIPKPPETCVGCTYNIGNNECAVRRMMLDAADAIEELDAEETRLLLITSELQDKVVELEEELNDADVAAYDNGRQMEKLAKRNAELHAELEKWVSAAEKAGEPKRGEWNNHEVACLLAEMFGDDCACNLNGIDEWLPQYCEFAETCCPNPVGVACWEQFLKHRAKMEVQDDKEN